MAHIVIKFRDSLQADRVFKNEGRAGGSYEKTVRYEGNVIIVTDEWGKETAFPLDLVAEVQFDPQRSRM